jgi:hypothetical protein
MPALRTALISDLFNRVDSGPTRDDRGRALEEIVGHIFGRIPGIRLAARNVRSAFGSEELDGMLIVDDCKGLPLRTMLVLFECKNWAEPVGSDEVSWFVDKLRSRSMTEGILIAANGVTGDAEKLRGAHDRIQSALAEGINVIVITKDELRSLRTTDDARGLLESKRVLLATKRTSIAVQT